jgi:2-hydroxymuconate-semialdehyde hydrolase
VIVPDLPGLGESDPVAKLDAEAFTRWFASLLDLTCREKPTVVAHSLSGSLGARFAVDHGDRLRRLIVYGAPGIGRYRMPLRLRVVAIRFALRPTEHNSERFEAFALLDRDRTRDRDPEWFDAFSAYTLSRARVAHIRSAMRDLIAVGTKRIRDAELRQIAAPLALLWGRHDRMVPIAVAEEANGTLRVPLHVIEAAAHVPHMEQPDAFLRVLDGLI